MEEDNVKNTEIESELFALVNSIKNLREKYQQGTITDTFFKKAIKNATNGLLKIYFYLKGKKISLSEILKKMNFLKEYNDAIRIIKNISSLNSSNEFVGSTNGTQSQFANKVRSSILELPGIASKITSSFITLMDALKLEGLKSSELLIKLLKELKNNFEKFPITGLLEEIQFKIDKIYNLVLNNAESLVENNKFREIIVDRLYQAFKEFQNKLN